MMKLLAATFFAISSIVVSSVSAQQPLSKGEKIEALVKSKNPDWKLEERRADTGNTYNRWNSKDQEISLYIYEDPSVEEAKRHVKIALINISAGRIE